MYTREQKERYEFQQSETGKEVVQMLEYMKNRYCIELKIPFDIIRTGKLKALVNGRTGELDRFYEE